MGLPPASAAPSPPQRWLTSPQQIRWRWSLLNSLCFTVFATPFLLLEAWVSMGGIMNPTALWVMTLLLPGILMGICLGPIQGLFLKKLMPALNLWIWMGFSVAGSLVGSLVFILAYFSLSLLSWVGQWEIWQQATFLTGLLPFVIPVIYVAIFGLTVGWAWGLAQFWAFRLSGYEVKGWVWASLWGRMLAWLIAAGYLTLIWLVIGLFSSQIVEISSISPILSTILGLISALIFVLGLNPWGLGGLAFGWITGRLLQSYSRAAQPSPEAGDGSPVG